jgi:hypothetical protein
MALSKEAWISEGIFDEVGHSKRIKLQRIKGTGNIMSNILSSRVEGTF